MIKSLTQKITTYVLVVILLAHNINTFVIVGDFLANQEFIAKTLCIQKDNQQGCNGKCHLKKQLAQNETGTDGKAPVQESKRQVLDVFFITDINSVDAQFISFYINKNRVFYQTPIISETTLSVDTPPPNVV
ncbi:hypothetical protein [Hanstruepera marina]|uniref:hypothetical protein n=1 Tax=Hanstruepera marina TaxID=2873265 RepID=UPI001CA760C8|nr:hypothetical protein [Hanstruepera marina]